MTASPHLGSARPITATRAIPGCCASTKELVEVLRAFAGTYMPGRSFGPAGFGKAGEKIAHRLMSVLTVNAQGLIAEYMDYG